MTKSSSGTESIWCAEKLSSQRCCQPGVAMLVNQSGSMGALPRTATADGVRCTTYTVPHERAR